MTARKVPLPKPSPPDAPAHTTREPEDAWEEFHQVVRDDQELEQITTSAYPVEVPNEEFEDRMEARRDTGNAWGEAVHERQEWGAAVGLPRERRRPPPGLEE